MMPGDPRSRTTIHRGAMPMCVDEYGVGHYHDGSMETNLRLTSTLCGMRHSFIQRLADEAAITCVQCICLSDVARMAWNTCELEPEAAVQYIVDSIPAINASNLRNFVQVLTFYSKEDAALKARLQDMNQRLSKQEPWLELMREALGIRRS